MLSLVSERMKFDPLHIYVKIGFANEDRCKSERNKYMDSVCKHSQRTKRAATSTRQVCSNDIENPRHVVDRAELDKTGFRSANYAKQLTHDTYDRHAEQQGGTSSSSDNDRSPRLVQRLWPGGKVLYTIDQAMSKITQGTNYILIQISLK